MRAYPGQMDGTLGQEQFGKLLDEQRVNHKWGDRAMTEDVLFYTRRRNDAGIEIKHRLPVGEKEGSVGAYLPPDEHIFGSQRDLLVTIADVGAYGSHDVLFGNINLRIEVRHAEVAASSAPRGHLNDAEGGAPVGRENPLSAAGMRDVDLTGQGLPLHCLAKELQAFLRLAAALHYTIDTELLEAVGLDDLPAAGTAYDYFEIVAIGAALDPGEQGFGVMGIDGFPGGT